MTVPTSVYVAAADRPWFERRPGVQWKILFEEGERRTILMRYQPGAVIPRHRHIGDEHRQHFDNPVDYVGHRVPDLARLWWQPNFTKSGPMPKS